MLFGCVAKSISTANGNTHTSAFFPLLLVSFIIRMPTMARISCFRDDVVFFIYLYQRFLYPVDASRPVEGGGETTTSDDNGSSSNKTVVDEKKKKQ
jgi:hypothetical protein